MRKGKRTTPVAEGDILTLEVKGLNHGGEGVAVFKGFTIFVPGTAPGDEVTARIISVQKNYARGLLNKVERSSQQRITPPCPYSRSCGGCSLQHITYQEQLYYKENLVRQTLRRLGGLEPEVLPVIGMNDPWAYRNISQLPVAVSDEGGIAAGFYEPCSRRLVDMDKCLIQHPIVNNAVIEVRSALLELSITPYDKKNHQGLVRHIITRFSYTTGQLLLILVTNGPKLPNSSELIKILRDRIPNLTGVVQSIKEHLTNTILGEEEAILWGRPYIIEKIDGLTFCLSTRSFFQVNTAQAEILFHKVKEYASLTGEETVLDLYCGTGTIALFLSKEAKKVIGIEKVAAAVEDAKKNAELNNIKNADFLTGKAEEFMPRFLQQGQKADVIVVDPPRKGCHEKLLTAIGKSRPDRIVYVSCNPATLARDLKLLTRYNYYPQEVQPIDMFPHTSHVETVVLMSSVKCK